MFGATKIETKFGDIYINTLSNSEDGKVRIWDSRREYMGYIECETLHETAYECSTTAEKVLGSLIEEMQGTTSIENLVSLITVEDVEVITTSRVTAAKHLFGFQSQKIPARHERTFLRDVLNSEWVNVIGDYYIVIRE